MACVGHRVIERFDERNVDLKAKLPKARNLITKLQTADSATNSVTEFSSESSVDSDSNDL